MSERSANDTSAKTQDRAKAKILLVDDDPAIRRMLARILADEGYNVSPAANGPEALELASRAGVDLILLDLNMPGLDGWETYEKLNSKKPPPPVIVITARPNQHFTAQAAGIGALLEKPLDLQKLLTAIRDLVDEPDVVRMARLEGRLSKFHYIPALTRESHINSNLGKKQ